MDLNIARILLKTKGENADQDYITPSRTYFDPAVMVNTFPGPALVVDGDMVIQHHNVFAQGLLNHILEKETSLKNMITRCLANACPDTQKATLEEGGNLRHYDLYALPINRNNPQNKAQNKTQADPLVFLFGKETTIEHNLTDALVDSRQMFKDLVSCSTDFAWETDEKGNFIYASPRGILGYTSFELNGKNAHDMIIGGEEDNPFSTKNKVTDRELWLKKSNGSLACLLVSAVPIMDNHTKWQGARGVCRDITNRRERESILRRTHKREHILNRIISTIRDMDSPSGMLENAIDATLEGIGADHCYIIQKTTHSEGRFQAEVKQQQGNGADTDLIDRLCQKAIAFWQQPNSNIDTAQILQIGRYHILMGITNHHGVGNGAIALIRDNHGEWQEEDIHLFNGITSHLGIAIEQVITHKELEKRAFTDELTNLLNRRAFKLDVEKRLKNQQRSHKDGAMLFMDLDNFKNINDSKGHAHGDMILKEVTKIIKDNIRVGDYAARFGGDEFAIWLDEISTKEAIAKAQNFVAAGKRLAQIADVVGPQPALSIGVAMSNPQDENSFNDLIEKADAALYQAKKQGKASFATYSAPNHNTIKNNEEGLFEHAKGEKNA